jgi:NTE family protein
MPDSHLFGDYSFDDPQDDSKSKPDSHLFGTYFPDDTFDFENKKLFVTVTDIIQGEVHYLESGSLIQALLASASFPGVFAPIKKGNLVLADGGIANNFPVEPLLNSCSKIIGVYVNPLKKIDSN